MSFGLVIVLTLLSILPAVPAVFPAVALGTPTGTFLYLVTVIALGAGATAAHRREIRVRAKERKQLLGDVAKLLEASRRMEARLPDGSAARRTFEQEVGAILQNYTLEAGTGELKLTGFAPRITVTRPDGTLEHDSNG